MATNLGDLLARIRAEGGLSREQRRIGAPTQFGLAPSFGAARQPFIPNLIPNLDFSLREAFRRGVDGVDDVVNRSIAPGFNSDLDNPNTTGPDQPDEEPGIDVEKLPGTLENFAAVAKNTLGVLGNPLGFMAALGLGISNPEAVEFDSFRDLMNELFGGEDPVAPDVDLPDGDFDFDDDEDDPGDTGGGFGGGGDTEGTGQDTDQDDVDADTEDSIDEAEDEDVSDEDDAGF